METARPSRRRAQQQLNPEMPVPAVDAVLDAGQEGCGVLLTLIRQQILLLPPQAVLEVVAYDLGAVLDIPAWCRLTGNQLVTTRGDCFAGEAMHYFIRKCQNSDQEQEHGKAAREYHPGQGQSG